MNTEPTTTATPTRRRWYQFSLRTLLVLVGVCCVLAWVANRLHGHYRQGQQEKEAIAWVEANYGTLGYASAASQTAWPRRVVGAWYPPEVTQVSFSYGGTLRRQQAELEDLEPLVDLKSLRGLNLENARVDDYSHLTALSQLEDLTLPVVSNETLLQVSQLEHMRKLTLSQKPLAGFRGRTDIVPGLILGSGQALVTDLTPLAEIQQIRMLDISKTEVGELDPLFRSPQLEQLIVRENQLSAEELAQLQQALPDCAIVSLDPEKDTHQ